MIPFLIPTQGKDGSNYTISQKRDNRSTFILTNYTLPTAMYLGTIGGFPLKRLCQNLDMRLFHVKRAKNVSVDCRQESGGSANCTN
jgi:hypothetical protein